MGDTNELMEFLSASLGATLDEIYQRLIDCDFTREDPGLAMFVVALLNALGREGRGNRPTEVVLMLAFGESGTAERGRNRLMRWRRGEMSGHDLAREPGLGEQRDHRLGEMPLPVQPAQPLIGAKRQRDGPGPSHSVDSPTAAPPLKRVRVSEIEIQTSETIETLEKKERDQSELCAKLQEYRAIARERDEWKKKFEDLQVAYKEDEIKHLKELYMAKVSQVSPEILASMRSSEGSNDTRPRTTAQELCASRGPEVLDLRASRRPEAPQQTRPSASSQRLTIPDPSDTYLAPQFQESFNQVARAAMDEINRGTKRTLARIVPSQRRDHSSNSSERATRTIACSAPGGVFEKSRVVDIRKNLMARHQFTQVPAEHPRACLNDMSWNPATNDQVIPPGSRHLIIGDSLVRDLNEIFVYGQTTILSFGGASVAQVIKMMEFQSGDHLDTLIIMLGTNDVSRAPVTPENKWEPLLVCLLNELKEKYRPKLVILCTIPPNPLVGTIAADFMNGNVTRWNEMTRSLVRNNPGELRLLDLENMLRMTDHIALTKDGVHFNTQRGRHWINDVFQTQLREAEQESRATGSLARTNSTGGSRIRAAVPESLANRLGPLATETVGAVTVAPSSNVRDRLGTAPPPRPQSIGSRLGRSVEQNNRNNSQTASRRNDSPATTNPASTAGPSASTVPAEGIESGSRLLWNRSDPSHWGQYKADMSAKLNMNTLTCREDAMRMTGGESPTVSRLYRIPGVDWLLAEQEKFSSSTSLRHVDLDGLPHDNTFGPLNTRSLTDVRDRTRERTPPARKGKFQTENKPNNKHHKMYRQFAKPPGQTPGEYSRDYPRTTTVVGDDKRYGNLKAPIGDGLFAAYDPLDMKAAQYQIVAGSDYLYTPRSLFWPDVIFLTAPKLDWGQAIGMMISVRRVVSMEPQVIVVAGSNDHLQSRGLLSRLTDGSIPSKEVIGEAIMTLLSAMAEVEAAARQRFTMNVVKVVFVLSPGYAALPEPLQFVYTMVTTIAEGIFNVIIPAPNRVVDPDNYYPSRSELPAVWADISNAIQGLRDCSTTRLVLDEVLGLELSNFARLLKLRPGVDDDHLLVQQVADDLWFRQMDHAENDQGRMIRKNMTSAEEDLMAMALRTKPHNNIWLYLSPRLCTLGEDAFEHAPAIIKEIHVYLKNLLNARELAGGKMLKLMQDVNTMSLDKFQADVLATKAQYERSDAILGGMGVGWTPSFLSTCYPKASRNLIASFVKDIRKLSIGLVLALYVTFGHENFVKGPANLFTQALADLRLDGLLTLIAMTYGRLGDLLVLLRYPEKLQGPSREFNAQLETASLKKMKDWRTLLLQYLLQQNRSVMGEDKVATNAGECKQYCGMPLLTDLAVMMRIDPLALVHGLREFVRERTPPARKGKFQTENKPNNKHHKMYRQFAKPPGQTPGEYSRDYPRTTTVVGDDKRYGNLKAPIGDGLFAAYDPLDMKAAKYQIVAGSDYLYTPRSLFWPDVIFLTAPKLDWGQAIGMMISVRRVVSMEPQVIVVAGSNDHLQSRGLLSRLTDGSIPSKEVIGEAIMTLLSAMAEVEAAARQRFTMNVVKVVFVLSPGYAALPEPLQFVYTMVTTIAEGIFNVIIPAPNRVVDPDNYYPSRSELPAVWADISNAIQGLRDCSTTRLVLDEVLGLELSNFARLLKLRPGVDDDHLLVQQVADDLWFRQMDHAENDQGRMIRKNMTSAEEDLMAMALRTKPHNNIWLYLSPRLCTLGEDAFEHAPAIIKEIHVYLKNLLNARELAGGKMLKLMQDVNTMSLDKFQADVLATKAQYERSDAILGGMGVGWTPSFLSTCYPKASRNLIASFVKDIRKLSIGLVLALYVTFGHENFVKGPANLFTQALADLRLDGLLTLIAMTYGRLGDLLVLLRYPEKLQGPSREFNAQLETASLKKMKDWRTLLLQYLLQQNRSVMGEDKVATNAGECKQYCGMPLLTDLAVMMRIDPLALVHGLREFVTVVYGPVMSFAFPDVQVKAYRNSVLYVNLVSVVDCSVLNWVEQSELRKLASDDRLFGRIAEPGWVLMDFNNHFKCRMGREDLSHIQFNPKLWNLRPVVKDTGEAVGVPQLPGAYAHAKENQQTWLPGSRPLPDQCPRYPPIRRMLLGVTSPIIAPRIGAARDAEKRMLKWSGGMEPRFISWNAAAAHTFDFSIPDAWSRKKIKALPSRRPEVSAETWNEVYSSADDLSRLKWSGEAKVVMLEVARESRGGSYITIEDLAPHGEELVEFLVDDELFYHAGDMAVPARPDSGMNARQGPSEPKPRPDADDDELMDQDDNDDGTGSKTEKPGETDLGALERDLLEYRFSEDDDGEVDGSLLLMASSSFMSPTKEASADLSPIDPISQARECRSRDPQKLLHESPRRRKIEESMKISFLSTLPEEEWERYQMELEGKTGAIWSRVNFMEKSWDVIRLYGTQSIMKVGLNQPIMREVLEKIVSSMESDVLTESVTEDSADDQHVAKKLPVRRARKGLKRLKGKTGSRAMNPRVVKSRASAVVTSLTSAGRSGESGQGDSATLTGGEKENLIPPMLLAGLTVTATRSKKTARTLADTKLEMEIICQCGSGGLEDYRPSRINMAKLKLEGQLDVVEYSRITVPESVHMGDPAGGYVEMLKARNSARGHLMAWSEKRAMQEYLKGLTENSNFNRKEYGTVMSSEANEIGLEKPLEISWRVALQKYFDETMNAPATVAAYLAHPCVRTDMQVRLAWCLMGIKKAEYEASNYLKSREQELELMEALRALISKDDSAIAWAKRKDALCFVRFVVDRIPTPVLGECIKIIRQKGVDCERNFLRALLELYQDMPLTVPSKESNDMENYRKLEEVKDIPTKK